MNFPWALSIGREDAAALGSLRLESGIEVAEAGALLWLRGQAGGDHIDARLSALPANARYEWLPPNQLRRIDQRIPSSRLPDRPWQPLQSWLRVGLPAAALPAAEPAAMPL